MCKEMLVVWTKCREMLANRLSLLRRARYRATRPVQEYDCVILQNYPFCLTRFAGRGLKSRSLVTLISTSRRLS
jgi:hypothetical protein